MAKKRMALQVTVPVELIGWIDEQVRRRRFSTRSHAVEVALLELRKDSALEPR
jgi:Arc/MetJ-type ribon-helix-helix transcriptional regulator